MVATDQYGARAHMVADDGHTPLSVAIHRSDFSVARLLLDSYRAHGEREKPLEQSFYDYGKQPLPLLYVICVGRGGLFKKKKTEVEMLDTARFLVRGGTNVAVRNKYQQKPADVALSQCRAPSLHQYLRQLENGIDEGMFHRRCARSHIQPFRRLNGNGYSYS